MSSNYRIDGRANSRAHFTSNFRVDGRAEQSSQRARLMNGVKLIIRGTRPLD